VRVTVVGLGAVGARTVRQLVEHEQSAEIVVADRNRARAAEVVERMGGSVRADPDALQTAVSADGSASAGVVVLAVRAGEHRVLAEQALDTGQHVVSVADSILDVHQLLELDAEAETRQRSVVVGAGFSPGLTCVLARHAARRFDAVTEIHVAQHGTGGPDCARHRHQALQGEALDWRDGAWRSRRGRTGRELVWFPEPIGGQDCYRAALPGARLLAPYFDGVQRVTARVSATRRDRLTALLPMLRRPHHDGGPGAVHVEVRGRKGRGTGVAVLGAMDHPAVAAATVAATAVRWIGDGALPVGAHGLAVMTDSDAFLGELARRGVKPAVFEGSADA
jgi:saccharopine dehydrogenase-like NADP-dependent oxidoreductase